MIIGDGMVASAFKEISGWDDDILFSKGVSNSGERDQEKFNREIELVKFHLSKLNEHASFVYFSTTSVFDKAKSDNPYIIHKLLIEELIRKSNMNFLILRLPNLVGESPNPNTLTNYFADCIRKGTTIKLNKNAVRHLIDVADLSFILNDIKQKYGKNVVVNVETNKPLTAEQILTMLQEVMKKKAYIQPVNEISANIISKPIDKLSSVNYIWDTTETYHINLLKKYYSTEK